MSEDPAAVADPKAVADPVEPVGGGKSEAELAAIAESKKYRERAQKAEAENASMLEAQKQADLDALEAAGKFKEKNELLTKDNEALKVRAGEWDAYKDSRKEELLESLPEDKRESYKAFTLEQLEIVTKDLAIETPVKPSKNAPGSPTMTDSDKALDALTQQFQKGDISYQQFQTERVRLQAN